MATGVRTTAVLLVVLCMALLLQYVAVASAKDDKSSAREGDYKESNKGKNESYSDKVDYSGNDGGAEPGKDKGDDRGKEERSDDYRDDKQKEEEEKKQEKY